MSEPRVTPSHVSELEARAVAEGARLLRLETNRALKEAIALYRSSGFCEVAPFNEEPYAHHWFEKSLLEKSLLEKSLLEKSLPSRHQEPRDRQEPPARPA